MRRCCHHVHSCRLQSLFNTGAKLSPSSSEKVGVLSRWHESLPRSQPISGLDGWHYTQEDNCPHRACGTPYPAYMVDFTTTSSSAHRSENTKTKPGGISLPYSRTRAKPINTEGFPALRPGTQRCLSHHACKMNGIYRSKCSQVLLFRMLSVIQVVSKHFDKY